MTLVSHSYVTIESPGYAWLCHGQLVGGFNPSEKYESQLGRIIPNIWKHKHVPNHQPLILVSYVGRTPSLWWQWIYGFVWKLEPEIWCMDHHVSYCLMPIFGHITFSEIFRHTSMAEGSYPMGLKHHLKTTQQLRRVKYLIVAPQAHLHWSGQSIFMAEHGCVWKWGIPYNII